jgi:O-antigen biosynthesis protein
LRWALPDEAPPVSIIIPTRDRADLLRRCLAALRPAIEAYPGRCEIFVVDNGSTEPDARALIDSLSSPDVRVASLEEPFNWSVINNEAVRTASGAVLLFLNNDAFMKDSTVLSRLVAQAMRPDVGAVGARLLYEDNVIQHAGILLGVDGHSAHDGAGLHAADPGYFGRHHLARRASAVTGACLATRRAVFDEVRGFDPSFAVTCNDSDYCLRIGERGYKTIYDPAIMLYHLESRTRAGSATGAAADQQSNEEMRFRSRWSARVAQDPFYNPHFERHSPPFTRIRLVDPTAEGGML